ncbi:hypothetical protein BIW11_10295 [Tropilaelaps mercedesae]|uniref:Uncharacterized protein n=1 Tax=Tropilaelaps mercedesae TaxID=418985 RepID=A0A1V9XGM9_9ACAR|nr:hypothetical protein BIW11_10295 [Tropilaelaps mercedesae]
MSSPMRAPSQGQPNGFASYGASPSPTGSTQNGAPVSSPYQPSPADTSSSPHSQFSTGSLQAPNSYSSPQSSGGPSSNGSPPSAGSQSGQTVANVPQPNPSFRDVFGQLAVANQFTGAVPGSVGSVSTVTPMDCQPFAPTEVPMNVDSPVTPAGGCATVTSPSSSGQQRHSPVFVQQQQHQPTNVVQPGSRASPVNHQMAITSPLSNGTMQQAPGQTFTDHAMNGLQSGLASAHGASAISQNGTSSAGLQHHVPPTACESLTGRDGFSAGQIQPHGFGTSTSALGMTASQKMAMDQFVSQVRAQVSESQAVSNVALANQLFVSNGITFSTTSGATQTAQQQTVVNGGHAVNPAGNPGGQSLFTQPLPNASEMQKNDAPVITMDTSLSHPKQTATLQTADHNAVKIHQQHVMPQAGQGPPQQQVVVTQQMDCQLQSMSMLPESELIRIINPDSFAPSSIQVQTGTVQMARMTPMEASASTPAVNGPPRHDQRMQHGGPEPALF